MAVRQEAAEAAETVELPRAPNPAPYSFPRALWLAARAVRGARKVRGTVFCDETFVTDGTIILRRDLIRGPLPDWLEHSPAPGDVVSTMPAQRAPVEKRWHEAVDLVDTVLRHPQMGTPLAGGPTVRYELEGGREIYLSGARLWLAHAATGAGQLWASSEEDPRTAVVAGRGRTPTAAIMPLRVSSCEDFEPWEDA